mmetsp:Transcript_80747/g.261755  ORF Transcript_80747/g.261755 Transcript_80747/m.261755 type:complete len:314 (+) Transcript_80747:4131-5072(+)
MRLVDGASHLDCLISDNWQQAAGSIGQEARQCKTTRPRRSRSAIRGGDARVRDQAALVAKETRPQGRIQRQRVAAVVPDPKLGHVHGSEGLAPWLRRSRSAALVFREALSQGGPPQPGRVQAQAWVADDAARDLNAILVNGHAVGPGGDVVAVAGMVKRDRQMLRVCRGKTWKYETMRCAAVRDADLQHRAAGALLQRQAQSFTPEPAVGAGLLASAEQSGAFHERGHELHPKFERRGVRQLRQPQESTPLEQLDCRVVPCSGSSGLGDSEAALQDALPRASRQDRSFVPRTHAWLNGNAVVVEALLCLNSQR